MEHLPGVPGACPNSVSGAASGMFLTLINTLMAAECSLGPDGRYPPDYGPKLKDDDEFDFIIVGAGSAGSIVANRLSEVKQWKILLLEAGGYPSITTEIPALFFNVQDTEEDWQYKMEPSSRCFLGLQDKTCNCPRGKVLGGTSAINGMMYFRSNRENHNSWIAKGNIGWDYESCIKHYQKIEDVQGNDNDDFGKGGPLKITQTISSEPLREVLVESYKQIGLGQLNNQSPIGYTDSFMTLSKGTRMSTAKAFLSPIKERSNLYLATHAHVVKILINPDTTTAEGVQIKICKHTIKIKAKREVILSAGAIGSPQILMNSGIGPKEHLQALGIAVLKDLRVGDNFQDHPMFPGFFLDIDGSSLKPRTSSDNLDDLYHFLTTKTGSLSSIGLGSFVAFVTTRNNSHYPDLQFLHSPYYQNANAILQRVLQSYSMPEKVKELMIEHNKNSNNLVVQPILLKPKSRGTLRLRNGDPFGHPVIVPNLFSDELGEDLEAMLAGINTIKQLVQTESLSKLNPKLLELDIVNCRDFDADSDDFWKCVLTNLCITAFHPVGTCKMGPDTDLDAVVDLKLKVHGVKGVRVIDASIMPEITSCNTNGPVMMIGEKGASLVREEWGDL